MRLQSIESQSRDILKEQLVFSSRVFKVPLTSTPTASHLTAVRSLRTGPSSIFFLSAAPFSLTISKVSCWVVQILFTASMETSRKNGDSKKSSRSERGRTRPSESSREEESSISSLGSFMEAESVARAFASSSHPPLQSAAPASSSRHSSVASQSTAKEDFGSVEDNVDKQCPHCKKFFSNSWAVPKHVLVSFIISCSFPQAWLQSLRLIFIDNMWLKYSSRSWWFGMDLTASSRQIRLLPLHEVHI